MLNHSRFARIGVVFCALFLARCSVVDERGQKGTNTGLIVTPVDSYSTLKARNLAQKYKDNLERVVVEVVRNPTTGRLQFANNIVSTGGVGFFAHSATRAVDERYLEVIVGVPEVFDEATGLNSKIDRFLSQYGTELLGILVKDSAIYGDPDVAGYGLNFSWRSLLQGQSGSQVVFERSVLYFKKDEARKFLDHKVTKEAVLSGAAIFAMRGDAPAQRVSYADRGGASATGVAGQQETVPESTIAALQSEVTEKDISSEKDSSTGGNEPLTTSNSTAGTKAEAAQAPRSDGEKKQPEAGAQSKTVPEISGKPAGAAVNPLPATGGAAQPPAVTSGSENSASGRVARASEAQNAKPAPEGVAESSEKPTDSPAKIERPQEVEKRDLREAQPPAPAHETGGAPEMPKQAQITKPSEVASSKARVDRPETVVGEATAQEGNEVKERPALIPERIPPAKPVEQPAPIDEAALRRDTPQESSAQTRDSGSGRDAAPKRTEAPAGNAELATPGQAQAKGAKEKSAPSPAPGGLAIPVEQPAKLEGSRTVGKQAPGDVQPPALKPERSELPVPKQIDKPATPTLAKPAALDNKPETAMGVKAQETKEVKKESLQTAEPPRPTRPVEQSANKTTPRQAEPIQEATLRKDLRHDMAAQKARSTDSNGGSTPVAKETPAGTAREQGGERTKENRDTGLRPANIEPVKPAAQAKPAAPAAGVQVALKSVEGYAVQLSFPQKIDAQRWSESLSREGYTTTITSIGEADSVRLRVGSFSSPEAAKTLLGRLQKQGLTGFVIQVPKG